MNLFSINSRIIVTCSNRLSPFLQKEISELGYEATRVFKTGVELLGNMNDCIKLNLHLRCASQVLFSVKEVTALSEQSIFPDKVDRAFWDDYICNVHLDIIS